jgi:hypothetical protein
MFVCTQEKLEEASRRTAEDQSKRQIAKALEQMNAHFVKD